MNSSYHVPTNAVEACSGTEEALDDAAWIWTDFEGDDALALAGAHPSQLKRLVLCLRDFKDRANGRRLLKAKMRVVKMLRIRPALTYWEYNKDGKIAEGDLLDHEEARIGTVVDMHLSAQTLSVLPIDLHMPARLLLETLYCDEVLQRLRAVGARPMPVRFRCYNGAYNLEGHGDLMQTMADKYRAQFKICDRFLMCRGAADGKEIPGCSDMQKLLKGKLDQCAALCPAFHRAMGELVIALNLTVLQPNLVKLADEKTPAPIPAAVAELYAAGDFDAYREALLKIHAQTPLSARMDKILNHFLTDIPAADPYIVVSRLAGMFKFSHLFEFVVGQAEFYKHVYTVEKDGKAVTKTDSRCRVVPASGDVNAGYAMFVANHDQQVLQLVSTVFCNLCVGLYTRAAYVLKNRHDDDIPRVNIVAGLSD